MFSLQPGSHLGHHVHIAAVSSPIREFLSPSVFLFRHFVEVTSVWVCVIFLIMRLSYGFWGEMPQMWQWALLSWVGGWTALSQDPSLAMSTLISVSGHVHQASLLQRYFFPVCTLDCIQQVRPTLRRRVRSIRVCRDILQPDSNKYFGRYLEVMQVPIFFPNCFFILGENGTFRTPRISYSSFLKNVRLFIAYTFLCVNQRFLTQGI